MADGSDLKVLLVICGVLTTSSCQTTNTCCDGKDNCWMDISVSKETNVDCNCGVETRSSCRSTNICCNDFQEKCWMDISKETITSCKNSIDTSSTRVTAECKFSTEIEKSGLSTKLCRTRTISVLVCGSEDNLSDVKKRFQSLCEQTTCRTPTFQQQLDNEDICELYADVCTYCQDDTTARDKVTPTLSVKAEEVRGNVNDFPVAVAVIIPLLVLGVIVVVVVVIMFRIRKSPKRAEYHNNTFDNYEQHTASNVSPGSSTVNRVSAGKNQTEDNDTSYARIDECTNNSDENGDTTDATYTKIDECMSSSDQASSGNKDLMNVKLFIPNETVGTEYSALFRRDETSQEYETLSAGEIDTTKEGTGVKMKSISIDNEAVTGLDKEDDETGQYFILEKQNAEIHHSVKADHTNLDQNEHDDHGTYFILEKENIDTPASQTQKNNFSDTPLHGVETNINACPDYFVLEKSNLHEGPATTMPQNDRSDTNITMSDNANGVKPHVPDYFVLENVTLKEENTSDKPQSDMPDVDNTSGLTGIEDGDVTAKTVPEYFVLEIVPLREGKTTDMPQSDRNISDNNNGTKEDDDTSIKTGPEYFVLENVALRE